MINLTTLKLRFFLSMERYYKENKKTSQKPREDIGIHTKKIDIQNI